MSLYLDSSAVVKLIHEEPEAHALRHRLSQVQPHASSWLLHVEVLRAVLAANTASETKARELLKEVALMEIDRSIIEDAATLRVDPFLRSLDAIHLASARRLGADLTTLVTYDRRMATAAAQLGLPVESPA